MGAVKKVKNTPKTLKKQKLKQPHSQKKKRTTLKTLKKQKLKQPTLKKNLKTRLVLTMVILSGSHYGFQWKPVAVFNQWVRPAQH